jgi:hypothetical protein
MKTKYHALNLPAHLKKYVETKYGVDKKGNLKLTKCSTFGTFVLFGMRTITFPQSKKIDKGLPYIVIKYFDPSLSKFLPSDSDEAIIEFIDRQFREELVAFVAGSHEADGEHYTKYVWNYLNRYGIVRDEDIESDTAKKIYRDYLEKIQKNNQKVFSDLSLNSAIRH